MDKVAPKIRSFTDLVAWQESHKLVLMIYKATRQFPREEVCGLCSQMRRRAVSIVSNIAEGFSRNSPKEKAQFYAAARGSATELQSQLLVARDIGYLSKQAFDRIAVQAVKSHKLLNGLSRFIRNTNY